MSFKGLLFLAAVGAGFVIVVRAEPPAPSAAVAAGDSIAFSEVSLAERFRYTVGSVGSAMVGSTVRRSVLENQEMLAELRPAMHAAKGGDGIRTRSLARKLTYMDSLAIDNLYQGRPVKAMKQSMEAKSLMNDIRRNLMLGV